MMLYKCNCCGRGFDRYKGYIENGERWAVCPFCYETDIEENTARLNKIKRKNEVK